MLIFFKPFFKCLHRRIESVTFDQIDLVIISPGVPTNTPQALTALPPDLVVVMNPIYAGEVRKALAALDLYPEVLAV